MNALRTLGRVAQVINLTNRPKAPGARRARSLGVAVFFSFETQGPQPMHVFNGRLVALGF
jgi:hypothetical protein